LVNIRRSAERGKTETPWLDSRHSFSFGDYHDPRHMGFGSLRVINEDIVQPGTGFGMHGHSNMEIITIVLSGALEHKDSLGSGGIIRPGDVQVMSAGKGILHSEFNPSDRESVHLLQVWIRPDASGTGTKPSYQQQSFAPEQLRNRLQLVADPAGEAGTLKIRQDARVYVARLEEGKTLSFQKDPRRKYWLQVAAGGVELDGAALAAGDGIGLENEAGKASITAQAPAEIVPFDMAP
jgi:quercetin 2,3-dioxygenase